VFQISLPFEAKDSEQREAELLRLMKDLILEFMDCGGVDAKQMPMEMSSEYPELCQYFPSKKHIEYLSDRILSSELREKSDTFQRLFDEFNRKFFFGRLPIYQVRVVFDVRRFFGRERCKRYDLRADPVRESNYMDPSLFG
jgi:hypothetical protein